MERQAQIVRVITVDRKFAFSAGNYWQWYPVIPHIPKKLITFGFVSPGRFLSTSKLYASLQILFV